MATKKSVFKKGIKTCILLAYYPIRAQKWFYMERFQVSMFDIAKELFYLCK